MISRGFYLPNLESKLGSSPPPKEKVLKALQMRVWELAELPCFPDRRIHSTDRWKRDAFWKKLGGSKNVGGGVKK